MKIYAGTNSNRGADPGLTNLPITRGKGSTCEGLDFLKKK